MKLYQKILVYGLPAMIIGGTSLLRLSPQNNSHNTQKSPEPVYITGKVKSERFQNNILYPNTYIFSVNTERGLKIFRCNGDYSAETLDALIDPDDEVKIRLDSNEKIGDREFHISRANVIEVNDQRLPQ